ncbi:maleylacetoacetate isomerase [Parahaliea mediterranea]|uniref:Maleylacetoacetate isomerase n=1 Tax=Parahaliea mediterranea TaxID=651086 RepID=A0A939DGY6_9GAMM|nr:maleylacetoacetate isomerase [Parahaliea mediterranea]MBN7797935.1 maleylacetoacetate isomerase [Parahaliea mediterranea]
MQLYDYHRSSAAYRVRIALNLKGLDYERLPVNLVAGEQRSGDYTALNPQGLVPALVADDGQVLTQSLAILEWLEECRPEPALLPVAPGDRARVRGMMYLIGCDIHPLNNLRVLKHLTGDLGVDEDAKLAWYHHWLALGFAALEQQVAGERYCFGDRVTLADACLVPQMYNARRFELDLAPYPRLVAISAHLEQLPAFAAAAPDL